VLKGRHDVLKWVFSVAVLASTVSCTSELVDEANEAERDGRTISNEMMSAMHPSTFKPGHPRYLERDFVAGADFICDEIKEKYDRDFCSEPEINWR
jgi:hypothetical protein